MKILEINKFNFPHAGADRHFLDLVRLFELRGNEVAVFSMDHSQNEFSPWKKYFLSYVGYNRDDSNLWQKIKGVGRAFYSLEAKRKIKKLLDNFQPDIVHIHNIYHQISPSILPEIKKRGIPVVMTVHDYASVCPDYLMDCNGKDWEEIKTYGLLYFVKNKCFKNSYAKSFWAVLIFGFHKFLNIYDKNIDLYIAPSQFVKEVLVQNGIMENKIEVLPHFHSQEASTVAKTEPAEKFVLYAGRISRDKGVREMIDFFQRTDGPSLYLAGRKEESFVLKEGEKIKYLGFLPPQELSYYMARALFVVSFSRLKETFGLLAMESIAHGKPFLALDSGAYSEIITDGQEGYICRDRKELEEKIKKLSADGGLRILLSKNAREKAKVFSKKEYYEKISRLFSRVRENQGVLDLF